MLNLIERILLWLRGGSLKLLTLAGLILLIWGTFAPMGMLVWSLKQEAESLGLRKNQPKRLPPSNNSNSVAKSLKINCYIVLLPGVGDFFADQLTSGEAFFLDRLVQSHPNCVAPADIPRPSNAALPSAQGQNLDIENDLQIFMKKNVIAHHKGS